MPETMCRKCGCELVSISECELCGMTKGMACPGCGNVADDKVHIDCLTARSLVVS